MAYSLIEVINPYHDPRSATLHNTLVLSGVILPPASPAQIITEPTRSLRNHPVVGVVSTPRFLISRQTCLAVKLLSPLL